MSISNSYPQQRASLNLDFANSGKLDSRLSYSRSSTGTYMSSEKSLNSENLLKQSQDFDTSWSNLGLATSGGLTGGQTAPDGSASAFQLTAVSAASAMPAIYQSGVSVTATTHTAVVHLKSGTATHGVVSIRSSSGNVAYAMVDFGAGTVSNGHFGTSTDSSSTITALGSDWFKITLTATYAATTAAIVYIGLSDGTAPNSSGYWFHATSGETMYAWGAQLSSVNSLVYDSPTTTQIAREYAPLLKTAAADEPRFEYAADGQSEGLLIEAQATNLARYGNAFDNWTNKNRLDLTGNASVSPDGTLSAMHAVATSVPGSHSLYDSGPAITSGTTYTASVYAKDVGQRYLQIAGSASYFGTGQYATFDLQTGSVDANGVTASALSAGNGWWRIQATMTATATGNANAILCLVASATSSRVPSFTGDDYGGVLLFGYQFEAGSSASSLVDSGTSSSAVTRASDSCSVDLSDINFTGGEVTLVADTNTSAIDDYRQAASLIDDSQNQVTLYGNSYNNRLAAILGGGESSTLSQTSANGISALSFGVNDIAATRNGASPVTDTSQSFPDVSAGNLKIGGSGSSQILNGTVKRVSLFNVALSDVELQSLTSS